MTNKYNGWNNYETWQFMLWYGDYLAEEVQLWEIKDYNDVYGFVETFIDELLEQANVKDYLSDVLNHTLCMIDKDEITSHLLTD